MAAPAEIKSPANAVEIINLDMALFLSALRLIPININPQLGAKVPFGVPVAYGRAAYMNGC
jgi:hypothetical protein